ncbi:MAG: hypothetical protein SFV21_01110 [Rhodospirillaceae bacterium]|nr:hypothetical protein [Rhodospirillaceae bacterium]
MIFTNIAVDQDGHSYFNEVEIAQSGPPRRISSKNQDVLYWQMAVSEPGHFVDCAPSVDAKVLAVLSGQIDVIVSNGEVRHFTRGDIFTARDLTGQGHITRVVGLEPCAVLTIAMPGDGQFK